MTCKLLNEETQTNKNTEPENTNSDEIWSNKLKNINRVIFGFNFVILSTFNRQKKVPRGSREVKNRPKNGIDFTNKNHKNAKFKNFLKFGHFFPKIKNVRFYLQIKFRKLFFK
jgi:hypothetical protein